MIKSYRTGGGGNSTAGGAPPASFTEVGGQYQSPAPTVANGTTYPLQLDSHGNTAVTLGTALAGEDIPNNVQGQARKYVISATYSRQDFGAAAATSGTICTKNGLLTSILAQMGSTAGYLQLFQSTAAPASGATAYKSYAIAANATFVLDDAFLGPNGRYSANGWSWGLSSAQATFTAMASATGLNVDGTMVQ